MMECQPQLTDQPPLEAVPMGSTLPFKQIPWNYDNIVNYMAMITYGNLLLLLFPKLLLPMVVVFLCGGFLIVIFVFPPAVECWSRLILLRPGGIRTSVSEVS